MLIDPEQAPAQDIELIYRDGSYIEGEKPTNSMAVTIFTGRTMPGGDLQKA